MVLLVTFDRYYKNLQKRITPFRVFLAVIIVLFFYTQLILIFNKCPEEKKQKENKVNPTYMLHGKNVDSGYLKHVMAVLTRLGFRRVFNETNFDLLWSHVYPFGELAPFPKRIFQNLKPHQKVNHFPGSGYFTNKVDLAVTHLKHIPRAFQLPSQKSQLMQFAQQNPDYLFVQKSNAHRGIKILKISEMNLNLEGTFVQEYIQNPFLVDGYKFDIGIYTVITSIDPLRVYIYNGDVLLRFCGKKYEPFDPEDVDKYIVGDDYTPIWEIPSLMKSYNQQKYSMKETLNNFLRKIGKNPSKIWSQIEDSIVAVLLEKEEKISKIVSRYKNAGNFFEMARFDFILDADLNVYLMEANMSPNLSSDHFPPNRLLYENVLFGLFSLVGLGSASRVSKSTEEEQMKVPEKALMVFGDECIDNSCNSCGAVHCTLCKHCLTQRNLNVLKAAYREYVNRLDYKRIFPPRMSLKSKLSEINLEKYSPENRFMMLWFLGKCYQDRMWC